jgi:hypothetical protein
MRRHLRFLGMVVVGLHGDSAAGVDLLQLTLARLEQQFWK